MNNSGVFAEKWAQLKAKVNKDMPPVQEDVEEPKQSKVKFAWKVVWHIVFALRKVVLALPVVLAALRLAAYNREHLPVLVGIDLQSTGEFAQTISRETAVNVPLMITFGCLGLMVISRKTIYPWLISVFTLVLPVLLLLTNGYLG